MHSESGSTTAYYRQIQVGWTVYGSDGQKIGNVGAGDGEPQGEYFILEKGLFFPSEHYIPFSAIDAIDDDNIRLNVSKDEIEATDWDQPPSTSGDDTGLDQAVGGYQERAGRTSDRGTVDRREEHLRVDTQPVQTGEVRVGKRVVEEQQTVDVPVTREEVVITRRPVDRPVTAESTADDEITIPITEERATATKDARVVEEIDVKKVAHQGTQRVTGTVKKEEFEIAGEDDASRR